MNEISDIHHDELHDAIAAIDDRGRPIRPISSQHTLDDTQDTRNLTSQTESASAQMYNRLKVMRLYKFVVLRVVPMSRCLVYMYGVVGYIYVKVQFKVL